MRHELIRAIASLERSESSGFCMNSWKSTAVSSARLPPVFLLDSSVVVQRSDAMEGMPYVLNKANSTISCSLVRVVNSGDIQRYALALPIAHGLSYLTIVQKIFCASSGLSSTPFLTLPSGARRCEYIFSSLSRRLKRNDRTRRR